MTRSSMVTKVIRRVSSADILFGREKHINSFLHASVGGHTDEKVLGEGKRPEVGSLWKALLSRKWEKARHRLKKHPQDACIIPANLTDDDGVDVGDLPLHYAIKQGAPSCLIRALVKAYPESLMLKNTKSMRTPLCLAALLEHHIGEQGGQQNGHSSTSTTCTTEVDSKQSGEIFLFLFNCNPRAGNVPDIHGRIPLHYLAYRNKLKLIDHVLRNDSNLATVQDNEGYTPALVAASNEASDHGEAALKIFSRYRPDLVQATGTGESKLITSTMASPLTQVMRDARNSFRNDIAELMARLHHQSTSTTWDESDDESVGCPDDDVSSINDNKSVLVHYTY